MPSFVNHSRTYTWPPSFHLLDITPVTGTAKAKTAAMPLPDIDDDPFAHFISPVTDEDDPYDILSLSAGILPGDEPTPFSKTTKFKTSVAKKWARYVARNHNRLHDLYHERHAQDGVPRIEEPGYEEQWNNYRDGEGQLSAVDLREPTRGRAQDLLTPERRSRGRRISRTHSGHRHSWREPSPDLFTVSEEEERESQVTETNDGGSRRSQGKEVAETIKARAKL